MPTSFLTEALLLISVTTNLTVEGIKKLLDKSDANYSSNIIAAVLSVVIALAVCAVYLLVNDIAFTTKIGVEIAVLMYLSFLVSTLGYDKVIQTVRQLKKTYDSIQP